MAKQTTQKTQPGAPGRTDPGAKSAAGADVPKPGIPWSQFRVQAIVLALVCLFLYANTFTHEAAFDDRMAITDNDYVQQGVAGIPDILTRDAYQSYLEHRQGSNQLAGGRYRPLSLITFAVEQQFMGTSHDNENAGDKEARIAHEMHSRHVVNVLLYALTVVLLLYFFRALLFPGSPATAFMAALLFAVLPIHTESVANVKSRDEILSLLFITLTFTRFYTYLDTRKVKDLAWTLAFFFLALLSKEYAVTLLVLLPASIYIFKNETFKKSFIATWPVLIPFMLYVLLRVASVTAAAEGAGSNVLNNPYLLATPWQQLASEILVLLHYLQLLLFPQVLAADYSYNQLPYTSFLNPLVWLSVAVYGAMLIMMIRLFIKRNVLGFAIAFYLLPLFLVSNLLFNIGAPMGERLVFHSSVGFAVFIAWLIARASDQMTSEQVKNGFRVAIVLVVVVLSGYKTIDRNKDWKNDETLFLTDVKTVPNSVLVNNNAAAACMSNAKKNKEDIPVRDEWFTKAIGYFDRAISIYPAHILAHLNRGLCYFNMGNADKALDDWKTVQKQQPNQENIQKYLSIASRYFYNQGLKYKDAGKTDSAIVAFNKSAEAVPAAIPSLLELSAACIAEKRFPEATEAIEQVLKIDPTNLQAVSLKNKIMVEQSAAQGRVSAPTSMPGQ